MPRRLKPPRNDKIVTCLTASLRPEVAEEALQQRHDKGYADPYKMDKRHIVCVGVNYSSENRNIDRWIIDTM